MALSGTVQGEVTQNGSSFTYHLKWSATQDIVNNTSTITVKHYWSRSGSATFDSTTARRYGITIDGTPFEGTKRMDYSPWPSDTTISTATHTVKHDDDGTKSLTISTYANGRAGSYGPSNSSEASGDCTASVDITLDQIPRAAKLLAATNFTDESGSTITYENPAGTAADVQVGILDTTGSVQYAKYRSISQTGSSYTFNLTDEEKQALIEAIPDGTNQTYVNIYIKTYIGGEIVETPRHLTRIFTVVNSTPEISYVIKDIGTGSTALTNDENVIIKGFNYVAATMTPTFKKGATAKSQTITNGSNKVSGVTASFSNVENNQFIFYVKDSFGNEVSEPATIEMIDYVKLTCNISSNTPTTDGDLTVKIHGNYFNDTFGEAGVQNTLTLKWRIKENDNEYSEWVEITPTLTDNSYVANLNLTGLDYKTTYTIQAMAADLISTGGVPSPERVTKSTPVYNWGEDNFDINGECNVNGTLNVKGASFLELVYPVNSIYLSMSSTNPHDLFGFGTWVQIKEAFLYATTDSPGSTGGSKTTNPTTLTAAQSGVPAHSHNFSGITHSFQVRCGGSGGRTISAISNVVNNQNTGDTWGNTYAYESVSHKTDVISWTDGGTVNNSAATNAAEGHTHTFMPPYIQVYVWQRTA